MTKQDISRNTFLLTITNILLLLFLFRIHVAAEDGYRLWLRYDKIQNEELLAEYRNSLQKAIIRGQSPTIDIIQDELERGLSGLLDKEFLIARGMDDTGSLIIGTLSSLKA